MFIFNCIFFFFGAIKTCEFAIAKNPKKRSRPGLKLEKKSRPRSKGLQFMIRSAICATIRSAKVGATKRIFSHCIARLPLGHVWFTWSIYGFGVVMYQALSLFHSQNSLNLCDEIKRSLLTNEAIECTRLLFFFVLRFVDKIRFPTAKPIAQTVTRNTRLWMSTLYRQMKIYKAHGTCQSLEQLLMSAFDRVHSHSTRPGPTPSE